MYINYFKFDDPVNGAENLLERWVSAHGGHIQHVYLQENGHSAMLINLNNEEDLLAFKLKFGENTNA